MKGDFKIMKCVSYMRVGTKVQLGENMQKKDCCVKVKEKSAFKRFINYLTNLFNKIFEAQGINIKDSALEEIISISQEYFNYAIKINVIHTFYHQLIWSELVLAFLDQRIYEPVYLCAQGFGFFFRGFFVSVESHVNFYFRLCS